MAQARQKVIVLICTSMYGGVYIDECMEMHGLVYDRNNDKHEYKYR